MTKNRTIAVGIIYAPQPYGVGRERWDSIRKSIARNVSWEAGQDFEDPNSIYRMTVDAVDSGEAHGNAGAYRSKRGERV